MCFCVSVAPWRFLCSCSSMMLLMLQLLLGASGAPVLQHASIMLQLLHGGPGVPVAPWRFWCSSFSMLTLVYNFFYGDSGAQIFSVELWLLHDTCFVFSMMLLVYHLLPGFSFFSIFSMVLWALQVLHSASGTQVLFSVCFRCSNCSEVLLMLLLRHGTSDAPAF
jgi:hypothetical protein